MLTSKQRAFRDAMFPHGRWLNEESVDRDQRADLDFFRREAEGYFAEVNNSAVTSQPIDVNFGFLRPTDLNACAVVRLGKDYIGVNQGVLRVLRHVFHQWLAFPTVLPDVGDASREVAPPKLARLPSSADGLDRLVRTPVDPSRRAYAELLVRFTYHWITAHEFAHLRFGHVHFIGKRAQLAVLEAKSGSVQPGIDALTHQTLEMDADSGAIAHCATLALSLGSGRRQMPREFASLLPDEESALRAMSIAIYSFNRVFYGAVTDLATLGQGTHPPAPIRNNWMIAALNEHFPKIGREDLRDRYAYEIAATAAVDVEKAVRDTTQNWRPAHLENLASVLTSEEGNELTRRVLDRWDVIRPELMQLKRSATLAE